MFSYREKMLRFFTIHLTLGIVIFALTACGQATVSPTVRPDTATPAPTSTATPSPTASATATQTPFPTLGSGPYIMVKPERKSQSFPIYDMQGGEKIIELPADGYIKGYNPRLGNIVSPNREWLVFYTGATHYIDGETQLPLTLKLLNIKDGTIKTVADVVTHEDEKLAQLAEKLKTLEPQFGPRGTNDWVSGELVTALERGIYSVAWSPDGRTLAFPAQIDGLSSDVYLYDLETGKVQQAEDTLQNITNILWSPDGKKIIFEDQQPVDIGVGTPELYAINYQKETVKDPKRLAWGSWIGSHDNVTQTWPPTGDWMASNLLLVTFNTPDEGNSGISVLNINTGQSAHIWEFKVGSYGVDPQNKTVLVGPDPRNLDVFLLALNGRKTKIFNRLSYVDDIFYRGSKKHRFILQDISSYDGNPDTRSDPYYPVNGQIIGIDANGKPDAFAQFDTKPQFSISPDLTWLLIYDGYYLNIYDQNDKQVKKLKMGPIDRIKWRPDSQAVFYSIGNQLYLLAIPSGQEQRFGESNIDDAIWLP